MCGGGGVPQDNSAEVARIEAQAAADARAEEERKAQEARANFENRLSGAYNTGISSAQDYFVSQGLDPNNYINSITTAANNARSSVPDLDSSPGTYFANLGASVYEREQDAERNSALRAFDTFARDGFAINRIADDADDAYLASILSEQRATSQEHAQRMLDRGIITQEGFEAAVAELDRQGAAANARLQEIGQTQLERGRGELRSIASTGRSNASNLNLGDGFDPYGYQGQIDDASASFFSGLADSIRALVPTDLFDTSGLANIAGAAQGAQNTEFDPELSNGLFSDLGDDDAAVDDDEDDDFTGDDEDLTVSF